MRIISVVEISKRVFKSKRRYVIEFIIISIAMIILSFFQIKKMKSTYDQDCVEYQNLLYIYNADLNEFESKIESLSENLEVAKKQYEDYQNYVNGSIYMMLPTDGFYKAEARLLFQGNIDDNIAYNIYQNYFNSTEYKAKISSVANVHADAINEVISITLDGWYMIIRVNHFDEDAATNILDVMITELYAKRMDVIAIVGEHDLYVDECAVVKAVDMSITNEQNGRFDKLKGYNNGYADALINLSNEEQERDKYIYENEPMAPAVVGTRKIAINISVNIVMIFVLSFIALFVWELFRCLFGGILCDDMYCRDKGLFKFSTVGKTNVSNITIDNSAFLQDVVNVMEKQKLKALYIASCQMDKSTLELAQQLIEALGASGVKAYYGTLMDGSAEELRNLSATDAVILMLNRGEATYKRVDYIVSLAERYRLEKLGYFECV